MACVAPTLNILSLFSGSGMVEAVRRAGLMD